MKFESDSIAKLNEIGPNERFAPLQVLVQSSRYHVLKDVSDLHGLILFDNLLLVILGKYVEKCK